MTKKTKIVATIGPATEKEEVLEQMIMAGMNIARFNTKHNKPAWHGKIMARVRDVADKLRVPVGNLLDLQGPEIRIDLPAGKEFSVKRGDETIFTSDKKHKAKHFVIIPQNVVESMSLGNEVLLEDGACEFTISEKSGTFFTAQATVDCTVKHRKTMNTPGVTLDMPSLTDRDYEYLDGVKPELIDFVGLSFVRDAKDLEILRSELEKRKINAHIIAKIENQESLDNIEEIIEGSDATMIARGDLGVEVPYEELIYWQKKIINLCRNKAKPVITATQMLKSMVDNPRPTRAEVSDVAHAIYDGTDAVMLSEETTIGEYPVKAIQTQSEIASFNEPHVAHQLQNSNLPNTNSSSAISHAAVGMVNNSKFEIDKIVVLTEEGYSARLISRFRLPLPIFAVTSNAKSMRHIALMYGVTPAMMTFPEKRLDNLNVLIEKFKKRGIVQKGESVMFIHGTFWKHPGLTNTLTVMNIE